MKRKHKRTCRLTPGTRFATSALAEDAAMQRKINSGVNGQHAQTTYTVVPCACNGVHLVADAPERS